jgi:hypothetical protein
LGGMGKERLAEGERCRTKEGRVQKSASINNFANDENRPGRDGKFSFLLS